MCLGACAQRIIGVDAVPFARNRPADQTMVAVTKASKIIDDLQCHQPRLHVVYDLAAVGGRSDLFGGPSYISLRCFEPAFIRLARGACRQVQRAVQKSEIRRGRYRPDQRPVGR